ncbi:MAG: VIT1/CCC1 transporter family protein [Methanomicrobiaceae archaeon]|nr:VIT1/CCC1 transporter family protein [Methanomicrobiaceae archaeon]
MGEGLKERMRNAQRQEITEYYIYSSLAERTGDPHNAEVLTRIAEEEKKHYGVWKDLTGGEVGPDWLKIWFFVAIARIFGLTFAIKLMERGEGQAQDVYRELEGEVPEVTEIIPDENRHEAELIRLIDERRLRYIGSIVLGLSDAIVELTGTLAGLSFALQNTQLVAVAGLITGIAASLSMGASEYLSQKSGEGGGEPLRAAGYTGAAYVITVVLLIIPFLLWEDYVHALISTLLAAVLVIFCFTYYLSVAKDLDFRRRFFEMVAISLGVAGVSFVLGIIIRVTIGIEV